MFYYRVLSIDIILGVLSGYFLAGTVLHSRLPHLVPFILGLAVWTIYTLDHITDARMIGHRVIKNVYRWHGIYRRVLLILAGTIVLASLILSICFLPQDILIAGFAGMALMGIYHILHYLPGMRKIYWFKEAWIIMIYVTGIWLFPWLYRGSVPGIPEYLLLTSFTCLVSANVLGYSWAEFDTDRDEGLMTMATRYGQNVCRALVLMALGMSLLCSLLVIAVFSSGTTQVWASVIFVIMAVLLGLVHVFPSYFSGKAAFGIIADAVFLLQALILLV